MCLDRWGDKETQTSWLQVVNLYQRSGYDMVVITIQASGPDFKSSNSLKVNRCIISIQKHTNAYAKSLHLSFQWNAEISDIRLSSRWLSCYTLAQPRQLLRCVWVRLCLLEEWTGARDTITIWPSSGSAPLTYKPEKNDVDHHRPKVQLDQMDGPRTAPNRPPRWWRQIYAHMEGLVSRSCDTSL